MTVLIGPFFVDWNNFRTTFENRASDIVGQPVRILGDIDLSVLPSPTITMNDVEVGDTEGQPMATIDHLSIRLELLPLISGQYNVTELVLDHPEINATVDDNGHARLDDAARRRRCNRSGEREIGSGRHQ